MSVKLITWAWSQANLKPTQKFILIAIADHANDEDFTCWPSITHLCEKTNLARSTLINGINDLVEIDLINRVGTKKQSTIYFVNQSGSRTSQENDADKKTSQLVREPDSPGAGLVREPDLSSPGAGHGTVMNRHFINKGNFEKFWLQYPRKKSKALAEAAFFKLNPSENEFRQIIDGLRTANNSEDWVNLKYVPNPLTFLENRCWEDEYIPRGKLNAAHKQNTTTRRQHSQNVSQHLEAELAKEEGLAVIRNDERCLGQ